jgi:hypothetical protein
MLLTHSASLNKFLIKGLESKTDDDPSILQVPSSLFSSIKTKPSLFRVIQSRDRKAYTSLKYSNTQVASTDGKYVVYTKKLSP